MVKVKKITKIIFWVILFLIALYSSIIIIEKLICKDKTPNFFGYKNFIVLTGSMEPTLNIGDIVIVKETDDIKVNDIISFKVSNSVVTHRVTDIRHDDENNLSYITKGDANNGYDNEIIELEDIEGKYVFKIPKLGSLIMFFQKPIGLVILLLIFGVVLFINSIIPNKKIERK